MKDIMEEVMEEEEVTLLLLLQEAMEPMEHQAQATLL